jgi:hypothetical protein
MPSSKRRRASNGDSPPPPCEWWSQGQGGSMDGLADRGSLMLANILGLPLADFQREYWLKKPYLKQLTAAQRAALSRSHPARMLPMDDVKALLRRRQPRPTRYTHDVDVTRYVNGRRAALSEGSGEIDAGEVWDAFESRGYSIRIVHPQQWHQASYELCACLQEHFGFPVGCSAYLTPTSTQGFPPHYDDVEVFVLQLQGSKRWRPYVETKARMAWVPARPKPATSRLIGRGWPKLRAA